MDVTELNALIRSHADEVYDPRQLAEVVLADLKGVNLRDVLAIVLPQYVRLQLTHTRRLPKPRQEPVLEVVGDEPAARPAAVRSPKVAARVDWWSQVLDAVYFDGEVWVPLREMTKTQVLAVAAARRKTAEENLAIAERFERLAAQMGRSRAATVGALKPAVAMAAWNAAA